MSNYKLVIQQAEKFVDENDYKSAEALIEREIGLNPNSLDLHQLLIDLYYITNQDQKREKMEVLMIKVCSEKIKNENLEPLELAKAYLYKAQLVHYTIDKKKNTSKAREILMSLKPMTWEISSMIRTCHTIDREGNRKVLHYLKDDGFIKT